MLSDHTMPPTETDCASAVRQLKDLLDGIQFEVWKMRLETPHVYATTPMLRGVWGRALRLVDQRAYDEIFVGLGPDNRRVPKYIIRPAPPDPRTAPAIDLVLINVPSSLRPAVWEAWLVACGMGLGKGRVPFRIREKIPIASTSEGLPPDWANSGNPATAPCRLTFPTPLRLMRKGTLLQHPALQNITTAGVRRVCHLAGMSRGPGYQSIQRCTSALAAEIRASPWQGKRSNLVRWSAVQQRELELFGVTGTLTLPNGPGALLPLLNTLRWLHLGKGTVYGMGQLTVTSMR